MDWKSTVATLANRFKEPSSWAGLTGLCLLLHVSVDPGLISAVGLLGAGIAGCVAFFVPEKAK